MRRSVLVLAAAVPLFAATAGCEDGPNQTYSPAPAGAANYWNGPPGSGGLADGGGFTGNGTEGYDASFGGTNKNILCTADQATAIWKKYFQEPVLPPGLGGGLDIAGGYNGDGASGWEPNVPFTYDPTKETWLGATIEDAEKILCQGTADVIFGTATLTYGWGNGCPICEFSALYNPSSRIITDELFQYGYEAPLNVTSTDGKTVYSIVMQNIPMTKTVNGGQPQQIIVDWAGGSPAYGAIVNEVFDAFRNTYTPQFPPEPDCQATSHCIVGNNYTEGGYFWFPPQGIAIFVTNTLAAQPAASSWSLIDLSVLKLLPWSLGQVTMKLDKTGVGPLVTVPDVSATTSTCTYQLGMSYGTFDSTCLEPAGATAAINATSKAKLFGAIAHTDEAYTFNIVGIAPQVAATTLGPTSVIADGQRPSAGDTAYELTVDQQSLGPIVNDYLNNNATTPTCVGGTPGDDAGVMTGTCQVAGKAVPGETCNAAGDCSTLDLHGFGMVTLEWANLVQTYMATNFGVTSTLGDPACIANPAFPVNHVKGNGPLVTAAGTYSGYPQLEVKCTSALAFEYSLDGGTTWSPAIPIPTATSATPNQYTIASNGVTLTFPTGTYSATDLYTWTGGEVCSGIEGIVTTAPPALAPASMAVNALGVNGANVEPQYAHGLKPSTWVIDFCSVTGDPTSGAGYGGCEGGSYGGPLGGYFFDSMQAAVASSFGTNPVPTPLSSRRFYFQQFILASIKYLQTADNPTASLAIIDANPIDPNQLFFDSAGGGFENGQYIFRSTVNSANQPPTMLNISTNLTTSVMNNWTFAQYNFRGDKAIYTALTTDPADKPGAEPIYLSNLAGSPVLQSAYGSGYAPCEAASDAGPASCSGYYCAIDTTGSAPGCSGVPAPVDGFGNPLYAPYKGAFGATVFNIAANGAAPSASALTVNPTDFELIQSANVTLPIWPDPYDPTSATPTDKTISVLLPYIPQGANVGFPVTVDGSRDKFYNTAQVQFTGVENLPGTNLDEVVDFEYVPVKDADGGVHNNLVVRALETTSYLGLIFACAQPSVTVPGGTDILAVRMYDNVTTVFAWLAAHPGAAAACGLETKYSIYGNYADDISFLSTGVRIGFNPGFGGSVASDGTLFDPNIVASLGQ